MKPLIYLLTFILAFIATSVYASCTRDSPDSCYRNVHREHHVKVHYQQPIIYCEYLNDARGQTYRVCRTCDSKKCVKEYFFDNYCEEDTA